MGFLPRPGDSGLLRVVPPPDTISLTGNGPCVVVHPGASAPARVWSPERCAEAVASLADEGHRVDVVVCGNTGPAHLAAAVGTPVVSLFAPVVPAERWAPYGVPSVVLGAQHAPCADSRARHCPVPGHPCLAEVTGHDVVLAVRKLIQESPWTSLSGMCTSHG